MLYCLLNDIDTLDFTVYKLSGLLFQCIPQSWYLAADFQLYMLAPIILFVLLKNKILGFILIFFCIASTISSALVFASTNEIPATGFKNG